MTESLKSNRSSHYRFGVGVGVDPRRSRSRSQSFKTMDCTQRLEDFRASWAQTGCTVMSDGWTDQKGRTLINFLVSCPKGTMFIKSVDASHQIKDAKT